MHETHHERLHGELPSALSASQDLMERRGFSSPCAGRRIRNLGKLSAIALSVGLAFSLAGCASQTVIGSAAQPQQQPYANMLGKLDPNPPGGASESQAKAAEAVRYIAKMDLKDASKSINAALQLDDRNSYLHFLNGFIYQLQARQGDTQKNEMAVEGYRLALRLDPGNWIAQEFLGLAYMDIKQFAQAKEQFTQVLLMSPDSKVAMNGLMLASYLTGDASTACAMADQFRQHATTLTPEFTQSSVSVYASCGEFGKADRMREELGKLKHDPEIAAEINRRLSQWKDFYRAGTQTGMTDTRLVKTSLGSTGGDPPVQVADAFSIVNRPAPDKSEPPAPPPMPAAPPPESPPNQPAPSPVEHAPQPARNGDAGMVLVDVVMLSTLETITTSEGVNLLNALTLQLGSATAPAFSKTFNGSFDGTTSTSTTQITRAVTIPALSYSLNIANAVNNVNEVLARPTLAAIEGQPSEFFAGSNLSAGVLSTTTLGSASVVPVDKRFGVQLAITPAFQPNGMIRLKVSAKRTFLNATPNTGNFAYQYDIDETSTDANVVMRLGDTLVLSGLSEKETTSSRNGVPVLQDVPVLQYLFSTKRDIDYQRSVLILITPRSPVYADKAESSPTGRTSESLKALRERMGFSGAMPANIDSIVKHMKTTDFYRQFRQKDVVMEKWDRSRTTADRLRQALDFLYY